MVKCFECTPDCNAEAIETKVPDSVGFEMKSFFHHLRTRPDGTIVYSQICEICGCKQAWVTPKGGRVQLKGE